MALIVDTGAIFALYNEWDIHHPKMMRFFESAKEPLIVPALVVAEADYLLSRKLDVSLSAEFLDSFHGEPFTLADFGQDQLDASLAILQTFSSLQLGITDASIAAAAHTFNAHRIVTTDLRHFRALRTASGRPFTLVPWDD